MRPAARQVFRDLARENEYDVDGETDSHACVAFARPDELTRGCCQDVLFIYLPLLACAQDFVVVDTHKARSDGPGAILP